MSTRPATRARLSANLTLEAAAKLFCVKPATLRRLEGNGEFSYFRASEAVRVYRERGGVARIEDFLPVREGSNDGFNPQPPRRAAATGGGGPDVRRRGTNSPRPAPDNTDSPSGRCIVSQAGSNGKFTRIDAGENMTQE